MTNIAIAEATEMVKNVNPGVSSVSITNAEAESISIMSIVTSGEEECPSDSLDCKPRIEIVWLPSRSIPGRCSSW